ncbi:MAG: short-chain fatty acyl-CoA regulator family protein [Myxococcota bacterium]|nr:short-chain fatty acyl-CoA regulator family protein [Myxococcota bacterium]
MATEKNPRLGARIRGLRRREGLTQTQLAARLGISASYINLIEHNRRPVTAHLLIRLARVFELDLSTFAADNDERLTRDLIEVFSDSLFEEHALSNTDIQDFVSSSPSVARAVRSLFRAFRESSETAAELAGGQIDGATPGPGRLPSEEVSDLIQQHWNYFPALEEGAEQLWRDARLERDDLYGGLVRYLRDKLTVDYRVARLEEDPDAVRRFDPERRELTLSETLPPRSRNFQLAHQIALLTQRDTIDRIVRQAQLSTPDSTNLGRVALANYFAGAVLMPYQAFLSAAQQERYDVEILGHRFKTSLEQCCHRLTSLRRPGAEGLPLHMVRVDIAGNISKKFTATGIRFARFGAACSLWNVFQAFLNPGIIRTQLSVMPDGKAFFCFATTVAKGRHGFHAPHTVQAIGMGCDVRHASQMVYADSIDLDKLDTAVKIGVSCRLCPREDCTQRAFPPVNTALGVDPNIKGVSTFVPPSS